MPKRDLKNFISSIFDNGDDAGFDYREPDDDGTVDEILDASAYHEPIEEDEYEEVWEPEKKYKKVKVGDCPLCGGIQTMIFDGSEYFNCTACGESLVDTWFYSWYDGNCSAEDVKKWKGISS